MSLGTWLREHYTSASRCKKAGALDQSLRKYLGTRKAAMKRHGVFKSADDSRALVDDKGRGFRFDCKTCALCKFYRLPQADACSPRCPLITKNGFTCDDIAEITPYGAWRDGDPEPMIRALRRAIKKQAAQRS